MDKEKLFVLLKAENLQHDKLYDIVIKQVKKKINLHDRIMDCMFIIATIILHL